MKKAICFLILAAAVAVLATGEALAAIALSKSNAHYANDMEFYYQKPRMEVLPGILRVFDRDGLLHQRDKQLVLASFFAQVIRTNPQTRQRIFSEQTKIGDDGRRTLAWTVHLAGLANEGELLAGLLGKEDEVLRRQMERCPRDLAQWDILSEPSVLQMYWGAFYASGDNRYLDPIIEAAMRYAKLKSTGRKTDPSFAVCTNAAATLYDMVPRHPSVQTRVQLFLRDRHGAEAETLQTILHQ